MTSEATQVNPYLFGWADPDEIRAYRRQHKSVELRDKRTTLREAISWGVKPGSYIVFGGMGSVRTPMAAVYEIIRQGIGDLTVGAKGSQHDWNLLTAAGLVSKAEVAYGFGDEIRGLSRPARAAVESGKLKVISETTNAAFQWRFTAAMKGLSFYPTRTAIGTDTLHYSGSVRIQDPFTGRPVELIPACYPDVVILHVHRADKYGNCQIDGNITEDFELAHAAKHVIVTTEKIVATDEIRKRPDHTKIPYFVVDSVVEVPYGSHPNQVPYLYSFDEIHWQEWLDASLTDEGVEEYLNTYIRGTKDHYEYLERIGGLRVLRELEHIEKGIADYPPVAKRR
ncbi:MULTISPECIES: CoA transferase subunit A [Aneurinibacillus]|nr:MULTISPECIES: CoA-transferase [Aneurinibacillus]MED0676586.1 CoA-transferase [Aneurinibacillus thermoaerophilus]MED0680389.1 CoA-transferase [Aneurinibacillus thermoaerophilus]MED0735915.1 CoA-transferase [Aneurinibacillus thermoaerophilus]MED0757129.1 CoA-transferase [Aneurinibacillus thermoaerophilus]MED0759350.1 CoA-transferase [Aneurinibacillus thermoaerophilus]